MLVSSASLPPLGMASRALIARLSTAVASWFGSASAVHASSARSGVISMCSPRVGCSSFAASSTSALTSTSSGCSGCLRAKASRCLVRLAPRSAASSISLATAASWGSIGDGFFQNADRAGNHGQDIVEVVRDATGELADRIHLLRMPQLGFRSLLFGQVPADEEVAADRLRPRPGPVQRDRLALLVDIARLEIALALSASRRPHLPAGVFEIVGVDEFHRAVSDHVGGLIAEDHGDAWADLDKIPRGVGHQDEVVRGIEYAPPLLDFLAERMLPSACFR